MNISKYPDFERINIKHKDFIAKSSAGFDPYSDYNTLSLLSWNVKETNCLSDLNGNLIIKLMDYLGDSFLYLFIGRNRVKESMRTLIKDLGSLRCVPEACIPSTTCFVVIPDRDNFDYVLDLKSLSSLSGGDYRYLRKKVNSFKRDFPNHDVEVFDIEDKKRTKEVVELTKIWGRDHGFDDKKIDDDILVTEKFLEFSPHFNCFMLGVYVEGTLTAFTFNELLDNGWVMGHFGKAINSYDAGSIYVEHCTARYLFDKGFKFLNHQQDTGIMGLREYKESLRPSRYLKKFTIRTKM